MDTTQAEQKGKDEDVYEPPTGFDSAFVRDPVVSGHDVSPHSRLREQLKLSNRDATTRKSQEVPADPQKCGWVPMAILFFAVPNSGGGAGCTRSLLKGEPCWLSNGRRGTRRVVSCVATRTRGICPSPRCGVEGVDPGSVILPGHDSSAGAMACMLVNWLRRSMAFFT